MAARSYQVKGSTIRSKLDFVHERFGAAALASLETEFSGRGLLPILVSGWYDFDLYVEVLESITARHFAGDLSRLASVGAYSAEQSLKTVYAAFVRPTGFVEFLRGMSRLHHMFYNAGRIDVSVAGDRKSCTIVHRDKPRLAEADLWVASGFYRMAAALHELDEVACRFEVLGDEARFELGW